MALKKLNIISCGNPYNGTDRNGKPYTIYNLEATNEEGVRINEKLTSFSELPLGPGEYEVERYPKNPSQPLKNYTVKQPGGGGGGNASLRADVNMLSEQVKFLTEQVSALKQQVENFVRQQPPAPTPTAYGSPPADDPDDDDIPF